MVKSISDRKANQSEGITQELKTKCDAPNQFQRFDNLFRHVISVPKSAIDKQEAKLKRRKKAKTKRASD